MHNKNENEKKMKLKIMFAASFGNFSSMFLCWLTDLVLAESVDEKHENKLECP